ncbi:MAG: hypothetical protein RLZZ366_774 [Pseudomonadota bacterium]
MVKGFFDLSRRLRSVFTQDERVEKSPFILSRG